ncbi:hypothetical protein [Halobacillus seohaensis]|uniref:Uncharacterized protein n=1 Tax=Halobacillus seohaensis TaxID=447421 RepID=A0ABW2EE87_9BACI
MKQVWLSICIVFIFILTTYFYISSQEETVIKYFPEDESQGFESAKTILSFKTGEGDDEYEIEWELNSKSSQTTYLRQDVSLLYVNGRLKGVVNKWKEDAKEITKRSVIHGEETQKYNAISFHHGEIHKNDDTIKSIQATSNDTLYIIDSPHSNRIAFHSPQSKEEEDWQNKLDHSITQQLDAQWDQLIEHYQIPEDKYEKVPLTELALFNQDNPFPYTSAADYRKISGNLWEGLYKNYVLGIKDSQSKHPIQSYIPLLLFDKNGKHLLVLYEDDTGEKHQLIQHY